MTDHISFDHTRRTFLKQAAMGTAAVLAYPASTVLGANDRVRVGMIGVGDRGNDLLDQFPSRREDDRLWPTATRFEHFDDGDGERRRFTRTGLGLS